MASSSSSLNWVYDVFLSFRGEDVRVAFRSHFLKELDRKLIIAFKDNEIERSHSLWPQLVQAIRTSRIAVVIFSKNYASSSWCLNELLEIVNCKDNIVIPVFYGLDPSHVRNQTGDFGRIFQKTCKKNTKETQNQWKKALTDVANMVGFDSATWDDEAELIKVIANDVLGKLFLTSSKDYEDLVGIEAHIAEMSLLLQLESEEVRMVGIWGSSGIGKTTIARALFNRHSRHFQSRIFIDRDFISKSKNDYSKANPDDPNMKLHLQEIFLSKILGEKYIKIDHLDALGERLKHQKVLIIIDDLDDQVVLDTVVGQIQWFGYGSRIIVVTNNKHFLRVHRIDHIYEVSLPSEEHAQEMLCRSAFKQNYAPDGFGKLVVGVVRHAGNLPSGLNLLGKYLRGRDKEFWMDTLTRLENGLRLDGKIEKILRVSYDGLGSAEDQEIFRHIACLYNHMEVTTIKSLLADSTLDVNTALQRLADKSLIQVIQGFVVMHHLLQEMGRNIVRIQSIDKPGEREFLVDPNDICYVLSEGTGTQNVLGISLDTSEIDELHVHESAFKGMRNLRILKINSKNFRKEGRFHLPESFDYLPPRLKLLCWSTYPMSCMPSNFFPENLVKLEMRHSKLHKLWEGVVSLTGLKVMDMWGSKYLKEIPDLSTATNLKTLRLGVCESLVELPSSIRNLNKLLELDMRSCKSLAILPTGFNLKSLEHLNFNYCSELRTFPEFSTNISYLHLLNTNIEELPSNLHLENLVRLTISKKESDGKQWEGVKQNFLIKILMTDDKILAKALKNAVQFSGVIAVEILGIYRNQMVVTGDGIDIIGLIMTLRGRVAFAELVSVNKDEPPKNGFKLPDENYFFRSYLEGVEGERDRILWDKNSDRNPKEAEIVQVEARDRYTEFSTDNYGAKPESSSEAKTNTHLPDRTFTNLRMDGKVKPPKIQVFINFRGIQLRNSFIGYLVDALRRSEINVFIDNHEQRGEDLNTLFKRIEDSGIAIVVFSSRYTESEWCLDELVKINERVDQGLLKVLPIFYKVTPTNVKRLKGDFGDHFRDKEYTYQSDEPMIKRWKEAIMSVSHKFALTFDEKSSVLEISFVETIVEEVLKMLLAISKVESGQSSRNLFCAEKAKRKRS